MDYSKYKAIPFWSWNDKLEIKELEEQIQWMKDNAFGGYFMHARLGLKTEYLGEEWFDCIKACCDKGEELGLDAWAYDENGWPSGFAGGKLLEDPENKDRYLTYTLGEFDANALVSYLVTEEELKRTNVGGEGEYLNVYQHYSPATADILNEKVVDKFIAETHEKYKKELGKNISKRIRGFFTDEPQYYRWKHPYTKVLPEYFLKTYNEDIFDGLGLMFVEKKGYRAFRYKYWLSMQSLMLSAFAEKIYNWCIDNDLELTGHYIDETSLTWQMACCAGIMPFYAYETIPGIDRLGRPIGAPLAPRQVSSVARQMGRKRVLAESYGVAGWDTTPFELKLITEMMFVNGVNLLCQHLIPYSEHGERKRDCPVHFSSVNPWVKHDFKTFNEYFAKLGCLIGESKEIVNVGLFCTIRSMYLEFKREECYESRNPINDSYAQLCWRMSKENIAYHVIDETMVERFGRVEGDKFIVGQCEYKYLVFPKTLTIGRKMQELLQEFYDNGGKLHFIDDAPSYLEGEEFEFGFSTNCKWEEIENAQPYRVLQKNTDVMSTYREIDGKNIIYAVNLTKDNSYDIDFEGNFKGFISYDIESGEEKKMSKKVHFDPGDSFILVLSDEETPIESEKKKFTLSGPFKIKYINDNYLTLDKMKYSIDGINFSDKIGYMGVFSEMKRLHYAGDLYLKYEFEIEKVPSKIDLLIEDTNTINVQVNGNEIEYTGVSDFEKQLYRANIVDFVKKGNNEILVKMHYFQSDKVNKVIYGDKTAKMSLGNLLTYDSTIEACYLQGDFGVYSKDGITSGKEPNVLIGDNFYISDRKTETSGDLVRDGYPFFAGKVKLATRYIADGSEQILELLGRHHLSEAVINGVKAKKSYFSNKINVTGLLKKGKNDIEITLVSSSRNLLGPHHYLLNEEPVAVSSQTWELGGTWTDGKSTHERDNYSFARFGLYK